MDSKLCLVSTGGDMSKRGMGDKNTVYVFNRKYKKSVDAFLKAQQNFNLYSYNKNFPNSKNKYIYTKYLKTFLKLEDLNIFKSKYDFRTGWEISFFNKDELKEYEPYNVYNLKEAA